MQRAETRGEDSINSANNVINIKEETTTLLQISLMQMNTTIRY